MKSIEPRRFSETTGAEHAHSSRSPSSRAGLLATCLALGSGAMLSWAAEITVDASLQHQTMEGFGTCLISWMANMDRYYKTPEAARTYAEDLRFNFLRCNLWGEGTIPLTQDPAKISHKDAAFAARDARTPVFISFAKAIQQINPKVKVIGTVWSPPAWMKENGSINGRFSGAALGQTYQSTRGELNNRVKKEFYPHFVKWMVEMARHYESKGVPLYALSPANEPQFTQTFESCVWTPDDLVAIIARLATELEKEGLAKIKIFGPESMTGFNWQGGPNQLFVKAVQANPAAFKALSVFATHGYEDGFKADVTKNSSAQFWDLVKNTGKPCWVTEGGTGNHQWPAPISDKGVGAAIHNSFVAGQASAFVPWQYVEGGQSIHALMSTSGKTKKTQVVRQFSRYIAPGSVRVEASPAFGDVMASAYLSAAADALTLVLINPQTESRPVTVKLKGGPALAQLQAIRTSATEDCKELEPVALSGGTASLTLPGQCILTLTNVK
jgi:glucuronoarabinoxylan endo-1,4-beta-xylanase